MERIGFIGMGHIAAPMARFLSLRGHRITVSRRNAKISGALKASHGVELADNQAVVDACETIFLCVRPHLAEGVIGALVFRSDQKVVSVMAGVSMKQLRKLCAPATDICMTIPLGYLEQGGCPLAVYPNGKVLAPLFEPENPVMPVSDENALNMHFAVCAFVPGVLDLMVTTAQWLAEQSGDADQAARYTQQLLSGFLSSLPPGDATLLSAERDALATEGTLSLSMTSAMHEGGAHVALTEALETVAKRLSGDG